MITASDLLAWAGRHRVSGLALQELGDLLTHVAMITRAAPEGYTEPAVQTRAMLEWVHLGGCPWRNNRGAFQDATGRWVRYGLANDSAKMDKEVKSSDLVGPMPIIIKPHHVGRTMALFTAAEIKPSDWRYTGNGREVAQARFLQIVNNLGGLGLFVNAPGQITTALERVNNA